MIPSFPQLLATATLAACLASAVHASPVPQWAVGKWVATTVLQSIDGPAEDVAFFTRSLAQGYADLLPKSEIEIQPHALKAAPGGALTLMLARHADASVSTETARMLMHDPGRPILFGVALRYDLDIPVPAARLTIRGCAEAEVQGQAAAPPIRGA